MSKIIGIDLGTTNSCVAVMDNGEARVLPNRENNKTTPSIVAFNSDGDRLVGEAARRQMAINPDGTVSSIKRHMGENYHVRLNNKNYTPQEISAMILQKLRMDAEEVLGEKITEAVITVPAYFSDSQRQATKEAGLIAGLDVKRIINEPTAAALAYGLDKNYGEKIMVFDLGGGTFDVSVIEIDDGVIEVLSTSGDNHLGGDDFNRHIADYIISQFKKENKIDLSKDPVAYSRIIEAAEKAKIELSSMEETAISLPFIAKHKNDALHLNMNLKRSKMEELCEDLIVRLNGPMNNAIQDAELKYSDLSKIILVGGSTRMPCVSKQIKKITGIEPNKGLNPDECVAMGAAIQAGKLTGNQLVMGGYDVLLMDVTSLSLSIETVGGVSTVLIPRNTTIPCSYSKIFTTAANFQTSVEINVLQGERYRALDNKSLGKFTLKGIKRAMRGVPQIEVTFDIDADGIVNVKAKDLGSGKSQEITIANSNHLSQDEIDRAIREAKEFEEEDRRQLERSTFKNDCYVMINDIQSKLHEKKKEIDPEKKKEIEASIKDLEKSIKKTKFEKISDSEFDELKSRKAHLEELTVYL